MGKQFNLTAVLLIVLITLNGANLSSAFLSNARYPSSRPRIILRASSSENSSKTLVVGGATGYIGKSVVKDAVRQGFNVVSLVRSKSDAEGNESLMEKLQGSQLLECDYASKDTVASVLKQVGPIDSVVCCLASRSGVKKDAYRVDYQATSDLCKAAADVGCGHFTLLSAFCCKNPWLQFQQAKLKFEAELASQTSMTYSIVRPTAFFKSVSGQLEVIQAGAPFVMFGDGEVTRCNPIAEAELAQYLVDCRGDESRHGKILNLGGPDEPLTMKKQGEMLFEAVGKKPFMVYAPLWIFDVIIDGLQWLADKTGSEALDDAAETGRIGKYYAVEDMLTTDSEEKFGSITLMQHYKKIAVEGQEYDPYTTMLAKKD